MRAVLSFGLAWLAALAIVAALRFPARSTSLDAGKKHVTDEVLRTSANVRWPPWIVTRRISVRRVMIIEVETEYPHEARRIASQLVERSTSNYDEILIYVRRAGTTGGMANRRVQWTPRSGYVEIVLDER